MIIDMSPRNLWYVFFRQRRKFLTTLGLVLLLALAYLGIATPLYESKASLLIKFGRDARPEVVRGGGSPEIAYNERREVVQSSMKILLHPHRLFCALARLFLAFQIFRELFLWQYS